MTQQLGLSDPFGGAQNPKADEGHHNNNDGRRQQHRHDHHYVPACKPHRVAWIAALWALFVIVAALFQKDVSRALILGLAQEALVLGVGLLVWYLMQRRKTSANHASEAE